MRTLAMLAAMVFAQTAVAETVLGRWCDHRVPSMPRYNGIIELVSTDAGVLQAYSRFADGSELTEQIRKKSKTTYEVIESATQDQYRVVPGTGDLQLIDQDGIIRTAKRLRSSHEAASCIE